MRIKYSSDECRGSEWISVKRVLTDFMGVLFLPPPEVSALHILKITIGWSFSDIMKYVHTAEMLAFRQACITSCFGRDVSVIKVFWPKIWCIPNYNTPSLLHEQPIPSLSASATVNDCFLQQLLKVYWWCSAELAL